MHPTPPVPSPPRALASVGGSKSRGQRRSLIVPLGSMSGFANADERCNIRREDDAVALMPGPGGLRYDATDVRGQVRSADNLQLQMAKIGEVVLGRLIGTPHPAAATLTSCFDQGEAGELWKLMQRADDATLHLRLDQRRHEHHAELSAHGRPFLSPAPP